MWLIEHLRSNKCGLFNELSQNLSHSQLKTVLKCKVNVASWKSDSFSVNKLHSNGSVRNDDPSYERLHILCPRWVRDVKLLHDSGHQRFKRFGIFKNTLISPHLVNKEPQGYGSPPNIMSSFDLRGRAEKTGYSQRVSRSQAIRYGIRGSVSGVAKVEFPTTKSTSCRRIFCFSGFLANIWRTHCIVLDVMSTPASKPSNTLANRSSIG